jgi:hypothetical protein
MRLIVPGLFAPARLIDVAADGLHLPALQTLLARATCNACAAHGVEATVAAALGLADAPLAPITLLADGGDPGAQFWLRADPVHLRVMRDRIVLAGNDLLELTQDEADQLCADIARHFGAAMNPQPRCTQRWYLRCATPPRLTTTALSIALGRDIDALQPHGDDAMHYRALQNELQMLLHDHPVNQAREARGALAVNSLWLWGGGVLPPAMPMPNLPTVYSDDDDVRALAQYAGASTHAVPAKFERSHLDGDTLVVLDALRASTQYGDAFGWRAALGVLERDWFAPLVAGRVACRIDDPLHGVALSLSRMDYWKRWRRVRPLVDALKPLAACRI